MLSCSGVIALRLLQSEKVQSQIKATSCNFLPENNSFKIILMVQCLAGITKVFTSTYDNIVSTHFIDDSGVALCGRALH